MIIPAYNEEESIFDTVTSIVNYRKKVDFDLDYVVINDGSTDKSGLQDKIAQLKEKLARVDDTERVLTDKYAGFMRSEYSIWGLLVK